MPLAPRLALLLLGCLGATAPAPAQSVPPVIPDLRVRAGYFGAWGEARDGSTTEAHVGQARVLAGVTWTARRDLLVRAGLGARYSTEQDRWRVVDPGRPVGPSGIRPGEVALSALHVSWLPAPGWEVRAGRMPLSFMLPGVAQKGLLRSENSNVQVNWTDGLHVRADWVGRLHAVLIHTPPAGVSTPFLAPLVIDERSGRAAVFAAWEGRVPQGPLVHRALLATVVPGALPDASGERSAYAAVSAQGAVSFPIGVPRVMVAAEAAYSPTPPERAVLGLVGDGRPLAAGGQLSVNLLGFGPGGQHDFGVITTAAAPGWLLSPSIRPNNHEWEARYYWRFAPQWRADLRVRRRQDLVVPAGAVQGRNEWDVYARLNLRL